MMYRCAATVGLGAWLAGALLLSPGCTVLFGTEAAGAASDAGARDAAGKGPDGQVEDPIDAASAVDAATDADGGLAGTVLADRGLLARYYMDEAGSGAGPTALQDSAASPVSLPLSYLGNMVYDDVLGRGLRWPDAGTDGLAAVTVAGTKINALNQLHAATLEVVVDIDASGTSDTPSAIVHIGNSSTFNGALSMWTSTGGRITLSFDDLFVANWNLPSVNQRTVLHLVVDSTQPVSLDRAQLFADGVELMHADDPGIVQDAPIVIVSGAQFVIGNDGAGARSPRARSFTQGSIRSP